jgi:ubiquinol-cytochrome c reductase iron-sulfur subunit
VFVDFAIDLRPAEIQDSYRFTIGTIPEDQPQWLKQDNLTILVIRRSDSLIDGLTNHEDLQDPESEQSHQPEYAKNPLRARHTRYFVSYAVGTDLGCPLELVEPAQLGEICGAARYDFSGRAIKSKNQFQNLTIPDYNFSEDFKTLTIRP